MGKQIIDLVKQLKSQEKVLLDTIFTSQKSLSETRDKLATLYWTMDELGLERVEDETLEELESGIGTIGKDRRPLPLAIPVVPENINKLESTRRFMGVGSICDLIEQYLNKRQDLLFVLPTMKEARSLKSSIYKEFNGDFNKDFSDFEVCSDGAHLLSFSTFNDEYHVYFETQKTYKPDFYRNTVYDVLVCENAGTTPGKKSVEKFYAVTRHTIGDYVNLQKGDK